MSPGVFRLDYRGDESSLLYAWPRPGGFDDALVGSPFLGVCDFLGQQATSPAARVEIDARSLGLAEPVALARHYDRGHCSAFQPWVPFRDQLKAALDRALEESGFRRLGNSVFTPILVVNAAGTTYSGDTGDRFRFVRSYSYSLGPAGFFITVRIEGGLRTAADGSVTFAPTSITVRNPDRGTDAVTTPVEARLRASLPSQLDAAVADALFQRLPTRFATLARCNATVASEGPRCLELLNGLFESQRAGITLAPAQARCKARAAESVSRGQCEFRPNVLRTQAYPEGFELVLSDGFDDQGSRLIGLDGDTYTAMCTGPRPPVDFVSGTSRGTLSALFDP